jgi:hypothetical protein
MHILLLSNEYPPHVYGAIATFVESLAQGLCNIGAEVTLISGYPILSICREHYMKKAPAFHGNVNPVRVIRFPYPSIPPGTQPFSWLTLRIFAKQSKSLNPSSYMVKVVQHFLFAIL